MWTVDTYNAVVMVMRPAGQKAIKPRLKSTELYGLDTAEWQARPER